MRRYAGLALLGFSIATAAIAADGQWRFPYDGAVPLKFKQCIIAFEDKRFLHHPGVDDWHLHVL